MIKKLLFCLVLATDICFAQLQYMVGTIKEVEATACWNVQIDDIQLGERIELRARVSDESGRLVAELTSEEYTVQRVPDVLSAQTIRTKSIQWYDEGLKTYVAKNRVLPNGRYLFCTKSTSRRSGELLGEDCVMLLQTALNTQAAQSKSQSWLQSSGRASIEYVYMPRQTAEYQLPPSVMRAHLQPSVSLFKVPCFANLYYTTERNERFPNQFAASFGFDAQRFRDELRLLAERELLRRLPIDNAAIEEKKRQVDSIKTVEQRLKLLTRDTSGLSTIEGQLNLINNKETQRAQSSYDSVLKVELAKIHYDSLRTLYTESQNELLNFAPRDSIETAQWQLLMDTVAARSAALEHRKDSVIQNVDELRSRKSWLDNRKNEVRSLTAKANELRYKAEEVQRLQDQKEYLVGLQHAIEKYPESLEQMQITLNDPQKLQSLLSEMGVYSGSDKLLFNTHLLTVGTVYPNYTPLTLSGLQVHGIAAELNVGPLLFGVVGGNTNLGTMDYLNLHQSVYSRWMVGGRFGFGHPDRDHLFFSYLNVFDSAKTIEYAETREVFPMKTTVLGSDMQWSLGRDFLHLRAEGALSMYNRNLRDSVTGLSDEIEQYLPAFLLPNLSTSYDYAFSLRADLHLFSSNELTAYQEYIGPGYYSFGVPFLRNDIERRGLRLEQGLFSNQFRIGASYRSEHDNLIGTKRSSTSLEKIGARLSMNVPSLPVLRAELFRSYVESSSIPSTLDEAMVSASQVFSIAATNWRTALSYRSLQNNSDSLSSSQYTLHSISLQQSIHFAFPFAVLLNSTWSSFSVASVQTTQLQLGAGLQFTALQAVSTTISGDYTSSTDGSTRLGSELGIRFSPSSSVSFSVSTRYFQYLSQIVGAPTTQDFSLNSGLSLGW